MGVQTPERRAVTARRTTVAGIATRSAAAAAAAAAAPGMDLRTTAATKMHRETNHDGEVGEED